MKEILKLYREAQKAANSNDLTKFRQAFQELGPAIELQMNREETAKLILEGRLDLLVPKE